MSFVKLDAFRQKNTSNIGDWLSAKVYSDVKKNACACGGKFTSFSIIKRRKGDVKYPICCACGFPPERFRIKAQVINEHKKVVYFDIRHFEGQRLVEINDVLGTFNQVEREIDLGVFDVRKYNSKKNREKFKLSYFIHATVEKDGEMGFLELYTNKEKSDLVTPSTLKNKKKYCRVIEKYFKKTFKTDVDMSIIDENVIEDFKNSFTENFSNQRGGLQDLQLIIKYAYKKKKITRLPLFEPVPTAGTQDEVVHIDQAREDFTVLKEKQYRVIFNCLSEYAWRQCEIRAIKLKSCYVEKGKVKIEMHFSEGNKLIDGRKSQKKGQKKSIIEVDMIDILKDWIQNECKWLGPDDYIFQQVSQKFREGRNGGFMPKHNGLPLGESTLRKALKRDLEDNGRIYFKPKEIRSARGTEVIEQSNGNMIAGRDFLGHTNVKTTEKHYEKTKNESNKFINKKAGVIPLFKEG